MLRRIASVCTRYTFLPFYRSERLKTGVPTLKSSQADTIIGRFRTVTCEKYERRCYMTKRLISLLICFGLLFTIAPLAFAADTADVIEEPEAYEENTAQEGSGESADSEGFGDFIEYDEDEYDGYDEYDEYYDDPVDAEEPYVDGDTIYDLENEDDSELIIDEPDEPDIEDEEPDEDDLYGDISFDEEIALQLAGEFVSDEIVVKFKEPWQVPGKEKQLQHEIDKVEKVGFVEQLGVYVVKVDDLDKNPNAVLNRFKNNKYIEYVEPNYTARVEYEPNDPSFKTYQGMYTIINAQAGWDILKGVDSPPIAIVDTGVTSHADLPPMPSGYAAAPGLAYSNDTNGHGTNVAGVIGMVGDNGLGNAGINWNATIMPVKIDDASSAMTVANIAKGIIWAADNGAKIINLSLGVSSDSVTVRDAINYAYDKGCAIFAAAGNDGKDAVSYPARYSNVMAVGATGNGSSRAGFSNYGPGIGVLAFGSFYTTTTAGNFSIVAGTSIACPQVAALASMIWAINPGLTNDQVYMMIEQGAKTLDGGYNEQSGYGVIDIGKTLELVLETVGRSPAKPEEPATSISQQPETSQEFRTPPIITLIGFSSMTLEYGQVYNETGYLAVDCKGVNLNTYVKVTGSVDIWKAGLYTIIYEVSDSAGLSARTTRTITVNPKPPDPPPPAVAPKITLIGSNPIILHLTSGTPYKEQMARAIDGDGKDISNLVTVSGNFNRNAAGTYTLTYSIISPATGLSAATTRNVRIVAPTEKKEPRTPYGLSGQAKAGAKVTHTGIVSNALGFMDLKVSSIDKNMTISVQLVDTATKKVVLSDTFTAAGTKQYKVDKAKYELVVTIDKANGNSKYSIDLMMPEVDPVLFFNEAEVPLPGLPSIALIGSNPIILHVGGSQYIEQGAIAYDHMDNNISSQVIIEGKPDTSAAGSYMITYTVLSPEGIPQSVTREVRIIAPDEFGYFDEGEIPLIPLPNQQVPLGNLPNQETPLSEAPGEVAEPELPSAITYIVVKGDSLWRIAKELYGEGRRWREIYEINKDVIGGNPDFLDIGIKLTIKMD